MLPGVFVLAIIFVGEHPYVCVAFMTISLGFNGAIAQSAICNYHDLAPNYASSLNAIINGISSCSGFITPVVVAFFTAETVSICILCSPGLERGLLIEYAIFTEHHGSVAVRVYDWFGCLHNAGHRFYGYRNWQSAAMERSRLVNIREDRSA